LIGSLAHIGYLDWRFRFAVSMAANFLSLSGAKAPEGENRLPELIGEPLDPPPGIYPGWQAGDKVFAGRPARSGR